MNPTDQHPDLAPMGDPELEARIVAWVAGEASAFEAAELTRVITEKPELAIFKRRIEAVHGLVAEAVRPDTPTLRLAPARRAQLLQVLGAPENSAGPTRPESTVLAPMVTARKKQRRDSYWLYSIAASLVIGFLALMSTIQSSFMLGPADRSQVEMAQRMSRAEDASRMEGAKKTYAEAVYRQLARGSDDDHEANDYSAPPPRQVSLPSTNTAIDDRPKFNLKLQNETPWELFHSDEKDKEAKGASYSANQPAGERVVRPKEMAAIETAELQKSITTRVKLENGDLHKNRAQLPASAPAPAPTLAGTRLNTEQRDIANAITVITPEFLKDVAAMDNQTVLQYSAGAEVGGTRGNVAGPKATLGKAKIHLLSRGLDAPTGQEPLPQAIHIDPNSVYTDGTSQGADKAFFGLIAGQDSGPNPHQGSAEINSVTILSPFEVSAKEDIGYKAEAMLAGKRVSQDALSIEEEKEEDADLEPDSEAVLGDDPIPAPRAVTPPAQNFGEVSASHEPVSTFSLHVSDVSFRLAQAALAAGRLPDAAQLRPEEFYNAFSYGDPTPLPAEKVSCRIEQAAHPFVQQRNLVRIAVKVASSGRGAAQPLHLTVLLDTSGSMEREDRAATMRAALQSLVSLLGPNDRLTLIGFARQPRLLAEAVAGDETAELGELLARTPSEGGTNLEAALALGTELAQRHFNPAAQNRVVLFTDGAANLGNADPAQLAAAIAALRQQHIAFDACGVGLAGLDDAMLENLTRQGDGRYYVLNSPEAAAAGFARQLAGAFRPAAENVKLQVRFNPARVGRYRLIGFEQHRLREEDFRNDSVDAAELAAEEAAVAVYQVEPLPQGEGELGEVFVRFRDAATGQMVERSWTLSHDASAPAFDRATPSLQLAGTAALLAEKLRGGEAGSAIALAELAPVVARLRNHYAHETRVQELATMFEQARRLIGE